MKTTLLCLLFAGLGSVAAQTTCDQAQLITLTNQSAVISTSHTNSDVWYKYTPSSDVRITVSTLNTTSLDTYVLIYTACGTINYIAFNDNSSNTLQSHLSFEGVHDQTYYIRWKYSDALNNQSYDWHINTATPSVGDFCSIPKSAVIGSNQCVHVDGNDQWFKYTATDNYYLKLKSSAITNVDTKCYITSGCGVFYYELNSFRSSNSSEYAIKVEKGTTYYIQWAYPGSDVTYNWDLSEGPINTGNICTLPHSAKIGFNHADHTDHFAEWYTYTAASTGNVTITSDILSDIDTKVQVFGNCSPLEYIAQNDNIATDNLQSTVTFAAAAGSTYKIKWHYPISVDKIYNWSLIEENYGGGTDCSRPLNSIEGTNRCEHVGGGDLWFRYLPVKSGNVTIEASENCDIDVFDVCGGIQIATGTKSVIFSSEIDQEYFIQFKQSTAPDAYNWNLSVAYDVQGLTCGHPWIAQKNDNTSDFSTTSSAQWYSYTAQENSNVVISCNVSVTISVYESCSALKSITNDPANSPINLTMHEGATMLIKVENASSLITWNISFDIILGIDENEKEQDQQSLAVIPNPNNGVFRITGNEEETLDVTIIGIDGRVVFNQIFEEQSSPEINASFLKPGIYVVLIQTGEKVYKVKIVKK